MVVVYELRYNDHLSFLVFKIRISCSVRDTPAALGRVSY